MTVSALIVRLLDLPRNSQILLAVGDNDRVSVKDIECDSLGGSLAPVYLIPAVPVRLGSDPEPVSDDDVLSCLSRKGEWHEGATAFEAEFGFDDREAVALEMPV